MKMLNKLLTMSLTLGVVFAAQAQQSNPSVDDGQASDVTQIADQALDSSAARRPVAPPVHHSLKVLLDPENQHISVEDTITFPGSPSSGAPVPRVFSLNRNLNISNNSGNLQLLQDEPASTAVGINATGGETALANLYSLTLSRNSQNQALLIYSGTIYDRATQTSAEYAQSFSETSGIIDEQGVYLSRGSIWIPEFSDELVTFDLQVEFADSSARWTAVSQGDRSGANGWRSDQPMEEVYLIAADFTVYSQVADDTEVLAYLRNPDPNLATKYMDATERYLQLYEPLLGDYPYSKFALVENFWETGYGMPSFTLLGEQVIRFPFILESSYPHEILHNWWGNGVYPDYESGNWSEGLTAYLADHLFQEMEGLGGSYRKEMLARYKNYVADDVDFPLAEFTSRNSAASQAVGYGKTLMLWHMLRIELGDELFLEGLRKFYSDFKFQRASFDDIENLFSQLSGTDLQPFFAQWVARVGAPELSISVEEVNGNRGRIMFAQIQAGDPYQLRVPVALFYEGEDEPRIYDISLSQKLEGVMAEDFELLQAVLVDPYFDVFRQLGREETPPTIAELFGASDISFVLPDTDRQHWTRMAEAFGQGVNSEIIFANDISELPSDRSVWILGRDNPFASAMSSASEVFGVSFSDTSVRMAGDEIGYADRSSVVVALHPANPELALGWIHVDDMIAMPGMIEKLPHYGKYSYLSFLGDEPTNDVKGTWGSVNSPMQWQKPGLATTVNWQSLPATEPLTVLPSKYLPEQLLRHANQLTDRSMQGRGLGSKGLDEAALYIADQFRIAGLQPINGTYIQRWVETIPGLGVTPMSNVLGMIPGVDRSLSARPVVIGAHYDHLGVDATTGRIYPGADDNASGISILIEVAAKLSRGFTPQRPVIFVAFTGEESGLLGSQHFVENPPGSFQAEDILAMVNLDAVGRLEGRSLQVFGTDSAYEWPFMAQGIGFTIGVDSSFPANTIASSDHVSFLNVGIPAIHLFSGTHADYHRPSDAVSRLDAAGMSDVSLWVEEALVYLANLPNPLRVTLDGFETVEVSGNSSARAVSLGTVPDFAYEGQGIRISDVTADSAAADAGLAAGDVLLSFNGQPLNDLQGYSDLLRQSAPGEIVEIEVQRQQETFTVAATLKQR